LRKAAILTAAVLSLAACSKQVSPPATEGVTDALIAAVPDDEWLSYGRDAGEQRFSPLDQVNDANIGQLGLAWFADLDTNRGQESTPLMHDGTLYVSTAWSMVKAYDARTGALKWSYDPKVPRETLFHGCCDAVNRGIALYGDKAYVATFDGRLVALDAKTGKEIWSKMTVPDQESYTITSAPRIAGGLVLIGSGGAEYKARGYLAAYDAQTGEEVWRFHTVPGNPKDGFENAAMERAAKTWTGEWWKLGGGGTVWEGITYDPVNRLVLFGTGNAEPWNPAATNRSGDTLFTSSIVAVHAESGEYAWHYQETPEDRWDYDSNSQIIITSLTIGGKQRRVALHAPKNGFFHIFDVKTGERLSTSVFMPQNWTTGIDPKTGRPMINPVARYEQTKAPLAILPGASGAHSWQPMSFSRKTGLVYIPASEMPMTFVAEENWKEAPMGRQMGLDSGGDAPPGTPRPVFRNLLIAWDPLAGKPAWSVNLAMPGQGGTLATAGNLVFLGGADGLLKAYSADHGKELWSFQTGRGIMTAPMSYRLGGEQYVALVTGFGGSLGPYLPAVGSGRPGRLLVFRLGGEVRLPVENAIALPPIAPPPLSATPAQLASGGESFGDWCSSCHGPSARSAGLNPDLRRSGLLHDADSFKAVVIDGMLSHKGMISFRKALTPADAEALRQYLIKRATEDKAAGMK